MTKLTVLTDTAGNILGAHSGHGGHIDPLSGITVKLVAGPGQQIHEIAMEVPRNWSTSEEIEALHDQIKKHLGRKKK